METFNIVEFFRELIKIILNFGTQCLDFLSHEFKIGDFSITALQMIGGAFIGLMALWFVKKFIPLA